MKKFNKDYTAGVLAGIPIFCVNRIYDAKIRDGYIAKKQYRFNFDNGYGASIIEFHDRLFSGGQQYELAIFDLNGDLCYDSGVTNDVERGNEYDMHELLCRVEQLNTERIVE